MLNLFLPSRICVRILRGVFKFQQETGEGETLLPRKLEDLSGQFVKRFWHGHEIRRPQGQFNSGMRRDHGNNGSAHHRG